MPIIGLTTDLRPRFPYIGKLRKGTEKKGNKPGADLDHFRFTSEDSEILQAFKNAYGDKPQKISVYLPFQTPDENFQTWCEIWSASGLQHRCDGETTHLWLEGNKYKRGRKPCPGGHTEGDPIEDGVGRLYVILPELLMQGHVGIVTLETHGKHDLINITSTLYETYNRSGDLTQVEFIIKRVLRNKSIPGYGDRKGQRSRADKWMVEIIPASHWVRRQIESKLDSALYLTDGDNVIDAEARDALPALPSGNGNEPTNAEVTADLGYKQFTTAEALEVITPKGARLGDLKVEQLQAVAKAKGKTEAEKQVIKGAELLIAQPDGDAYASWFNLVEEADKLKLDPPMDEPKTNIELVTAYKALSEKIDNAQIPEAFQ